jgi:rhodanese-related sulfurtransferase
MIRTKKILFILILIESSYFYGCLKDKITPPPDVLLDNAGQLLFYLEDEGDYINTVEAPSLVNAVEVYSNLHNYLLIDIRPPIDFSAGHIEGAINLTHSALVSFLESINYKKYSKVIIISRNGQSSAYYTCLLRLYGFENTYSLSYGMAAWNIAFSDEWFGALQEDYSLLEDFTAVYYSNSAYSALPNVVLSDSSLESSVKHRIKDIMNIEYEDNLGSQESTATIEFTTLAAHIEDFFIVCYDEGLLYKDHTDGITHPEESVWFRPPPASDFSSSRFLQTLPSDSKVVIYTTNGELSAFVVAYLRILGYNAKSVLFGANNMFYNSLLNANGLNQYAFSSAKIKNYPYVTGG